MRTMTAHVEDSLAGRVDALAARLDRARDWVGYVDYIADGRYGLTTPLRQFEPVDVRRGGISRREVRFLLDLPANTMTVIRIFHERDDR